MDGPGIVVARAIARDGLKLDAEEQPTLRVYTGRPFSLRFAYKIYETSRDEDTWKFRIRAAPPGAAPAENERVHTDRKVFTDDVWANISVEHTFDEPGDYEVEYEVEAEMSRRTWGDASPPSTVERRDHKGRVRVEAVRA